MAVQSVSASRLKLWNVRQVLEGYVFLGQVHGLGAEVSTAFAAAIVRSHAFGCFHCTLHADCKTGLIGCLCVVAYG